MKLILAVLALIMLTPTQANAYEQTRTQLFYADHTTLANWRVDEAVYTWNRKQEKIWLTKVDRCPVVNSPYCITLVDQYDSTAVDYQRRVVGECYCIPGYNETNNQIKLYTWAFDNPNTRTNNNYQRVVCHELGHWLLQRYDHPNHGCMGTNGNKYRPGRYLKALIPNWQTSESESA